MFIIPIEKDNPVYFTPWIVYILVVANTLIFFPTKYLLPFEEIINNFGFIPVSHAPLSLLSSIFLHGGIMHILGNMFFLWMFGDNVEDVIGPLFFLVAYLICGLSASLLHYVFSMHSITPCIGASGAISGIVGIYWFFPS
jgi:membrane associated rhomboid family serine protease